MAILDSEHIHFTCTSTPRTVYFTKSRHLKHTNQFESYFSCLFKLTYAYGILLSIREADMPSSLSCTRLWFVRSFVRSSFHYIEKILLCAHLTGAVVVIVVAVAHIFHSICLSNSFSLLSFSIPMESARRRQCVSFVYGK